MFDGTSPFSGAAPAEISSPTLQRTRGQARVAVEADPSRPGRSRVTELYQSGAAKIRMPRIYDHNGLELVAINTAGGLTGGDDITLDMRLGPGTNTVYTTQASEKIYRSIYGAASVTNTVILEGDASLIWMPQETIFFNRAALNRKLGFSLESGARLLAMEPMMFGRQAMGETVEEGTWRDSWRVKLDGKLVFADETRLGGKISEILSKTGIADGALAVASGVYIGEDAEQIIESLKTLEWPDGVQAGASLSESHIILRAVARDGALLKLWGAQVLKCITGLGLPRTWNC